MGRVEDEIAGIVDEWFQGEPTPEGQQNMRRTHLIADLAAYARRLREDFYSSNRVIHRLEAELVQARAHIAEEIADAIEADGFGAECGAVYRRVARIARDYGKEG